MSGNSRRHDPGRPQSEDDHRATVRHPGVLDTLPGGGQYVGQEHEPVVGRSLGHLDRQTVAERYPEELSLAARYLAVELGVAEQRRAGAVLVHLSGLTLRVQTVIAHP